MVEKILESILTTDNSCHWTDKELEAYLQKVKDNMPITYHFNEGRSTIHIIPTKGINPIKVSFIN